MPATMTIRIDEALKERLERIAEATNRSKSLLAAEAVKEFVELNEWQVSEIAQSIQEADAGEFALQDEVRVFAEKWS